MSFFRIWTEGEKQAAEDAKAQSIAMNAYWQAKLAEKQQAERAASDASYAAVLTARADAILREHHGVVNARLTRAAPMRIKPDKALPKALVWMPAGEHFIRAANMAGHPVETRVVCDRQGAATVTAAFLERAAANAPCWIDANHTAEAATAWVHGFEFDAAVGIVAKVEWTALGEEIVRGGSLISFSPTFMIDRETCRVSGLLASGPVGGLVNEPAFREMPMIAAADCARSAVACSMRENLLSNGYPGHVADLVAVSIEEGRSPEAIALLIKSYR